MLWVLLAMLVVHQFRRLSTLPRRMASYPSRQSHWKAQAPQSLPGPTFAGQPKLPNLPVPELENTLEKLKQSLKPIAWSTAEYNAALAKIDRFARIGPKFQHRLLQRHATTDHWLEEWWDRDAYLAYRDSVVINVSYYYGFEDHPAHLPQGAVSRAASIIRAAILFRKKFKLGQVLPEATKEGPLCMDTWRWMFDCSRVPGIEGCDYSVSHAKPGETGDSGHVVVIRQGRLWKIDIAQDGKLISTADLERQIQHIVDNTTDSPGVPILTASNRDVWAQDYQNLRSDPHNSEIIDAIESSAFVMCLDSEKPSDFIDFSRSLWHGAVSHNKGDIVLGLRNRWVDKPCQFVVFDNGKAGFMGEHSVMDGTPTVTLCDQVLKALKDPNFDHGTVTSNRAQPTPLDFNISHTTKKSITQATEAALALINTQAMSYHLTSYGKAAIKKFGVSPDSWAQMIIQLAYARLLAANGQKRNGGTYESATTRKFYKGRTEVIRVVSSESDEFVQSMLSSSSSSNLSSAEKRHLFQKAAKAHIKYAKEAGAGQGIDRHLKGLKEVMSKEEAGSVELFDDPVYKRSSNWVLSTSAIFSSGFRVYGWGEVVPEGYGVAYMTGFDDQLQFTITSRVEQPNQQFCDEIKKAAVDMYELFEKHTKL